MTLCFHIAKSGCGDVSGGSVDCFFDVPGA